MPILTFRASDELTRYLEAEVARRGISRSDIIREAFGFRAEKPRRRPRRAVDSGRRPAAPRSRTEAPVGQPEAPSPYTAPETPKPEIGVSELAERMGIPQFLAQRYLDEGRVTGDGEQVLVDGQPV